MQLEFDLSVAFYRRVYRNEKLMYHLSPSLLKVLHPELRCRSQVGNDDSR